MESGNGYERHINSHPHSPYAILALVEDGVGTFSSEILEQYHTLLRQ